MTKIKECVHCRKTISGRFRYCSDACRILANLHYVVDVWDEDEGRYLPVFFRTVYATEARERANEEEKENRTTRIREVQAD